MKFNFWLTSLISRSILRVACHAYFSAWMDSKFICSYSRLRGRISHLSIKFHQFLMEIACDIFFRNKFGHETLISSHRRLNASSYNIHVCGKIINNELNQSIAAVFSFNLSYELLYQRFEIFICISVVAPEIVSVSPICLFASKFSNQNVVCVSHCRYSPYIPCLSRSRLFYHSSNIRLRAQITEKNATENFIF
jgi:hypothetical protein